MTAIEGSGQRHYHDTSSAYVLPNDVIEQARLDAQAAAIVDMIGGVPFLGLKSATSKVLKAVDVGCGTGIATIQMAHEFPAAQVYGLDISPVPAEVQNMAPANTFWAVGNVLDFDHNSTSDDIIGHKIFNPGELNYIFGRMLFLGVNNWSRYFEIAAQSLGPGSIIEHQDLDWKFYRVGTSECLSDDWEWHRAILDAAEQSGLSTKAGSGAALHMHKAGLDIIDVKTFEFSFVPSSKTPDSQAMGRYVQSKLLPNYPELLRKMLGSQGIGDQEIVRLTNECLHDITSEEGVHQKYTVTIARKG